MINGNSRRRLMLGGGAVLGTLLILAIVVLVQYVALKHPMRWDLTSIGRYTLSPQSTGVLESYKEKKVPIEVLAFYESKDMGAKDMAKDLLNQYRDVDANFTFRFIDPDRERALAVQYGVENYPTLVIKAGSKQEPVTTADEETITNALVKLSRDDVKKVYLLKGHGEVSPEDTEGKGFSVAKTFIQKQNYKVGELLLLQAPEVPKDAAMLIIAGPTTDPSETELESIKRYVEDGGKLMVMLRPFRTPKLSAFLKNYGFVIAPGDVVIDRVSRVLGGDPLMPIISTYVEFPITKNFNLASVLPLARSIRASKEPIPFVLPKELAFSGPLTWTINEEQLKSGKAEFNPETGLKGPIPVMAVSTYTNLKSMGSGSGDNKDEFDDDASSGKNAASTSQRDPSKRKELKPKKARIVVFGSSDFASNKFFRLLGNSDLFMNTVSWLAEDEELITIRAKSEKAGPLVLAGNQALAVFIIPLLIVPGAWIIIGVAVFAVRRRATTV
jgi:gliding motility-associatede transport system auxiliary component